ncbi:MAG: sigma factor-like helix-turn-helix DNA-binding protein [Patescibacteria group bacterium]
MSKTNFNPKSITKILVSPLNDRTRDIISLRYGLGQSADRKTLEAIGQNYGITRERIRQLENFALKSIRQNKNFERASDVFGELKDIISSKGVLLSEDEILDLLAKDEDVKNHIHFLLVLGDDFKKFKEDDEFYHRWTVDEARADLIHDFLRKLYKEVEKENAIPEKEFMALAQGNAKDVLKEKILEEVILSWLKISKLIDRNALGEWGPVYSEYIKPRGMRDLAFLVFRKSGSPLHFTEVAKSILNTFSKEAHPATVHNELIKDPRFVLVGRGIYALKDWGYSEGTVRDIIKNILKADKYLPKEDIIKKVLKERYVKENTILVNLQNRRYFRRNSNGTYSLL